MGLPAPAATTITTAAAAADAVRGKLEQGLIAGHAASHTWLGSKSSAKSSKSGPRSLESLKDAPLLP
jgi:hypothetical protein